jgi:hypothetical protein
VVLEPVRLGERDAVDRPRDEQLVWLDSAWMNVLPQPLRHLREPLARVLGVPDQPVDYADTVTQVLHA